jgi:hypothetical protein
MQKMCPDGKLKRVSPIARQCASQRDRRGCQHRVGNHGIGGCQVHYELHRAGNVVSTMGVVAVVVRWEEWSGRLSGLLPMRVNMMMTARAVTMMVSSFGWLILKWAASRHFPVRMVSAAPKHEVQ